MKLLTVIGARPQFIKTAALSRELKIRNCSEIIVHTGQHYDPNMSEVFFEELKISSPKYQLEIKSSKHGEMTGMMLSEIERVCLLEKPDILVVYGDTNSTLAGALAAAKIHIPIAHIEAGLRSFNKSMPEEINRLLTDHMSDILFPPTKTAESHLISEGIDKNKIHVVGDIMYDVSKYYAPLSEQKENLLFKLNVKKKEYILVTCHRQENTNSPERLKAIFTALMRISERYPVICPLHPRTKKYLSEVSWFKETPQLKIIEPVGYLEMIALERNAKLITTDSGGIQKEAYFYHVPCVTFRDETEWTELVENNWNTLCPPTSDENIIRAIEKSLDTKGNDVNLYGEGNTAKLIADVILSK